jgi:hypothetical protein
MSDSISVGGVEFWLDRTDARRPFRLSVIVTIDPAIAGEAVAAGKAGYRAKLRESLIRETGSQFALVQKIRVAADREQTRVRTLQQAVRTLAEQVDTALLSGDDPTSARSELRAAQAELAGLEADLGRVRAGRARIENALALDGQRIENRLRRELKLGPEFSETAAALEVAMTAAAPLLVQVLSACEPLNMASSILDEALRAVEPVHPSPAPTIEPRRRKRASPPPGENPGPSLPLTPEVST